MTATATGREEENMRSATAERQCRRFSLPEIHQATEDFSDAHVIGQGGFGKVYRGLIDNERETVAITRLEPNSNQGAREFLTEIETLSKIKHVNLVSLIGYCDEHGEMILVYEYIARGTLANHLYKLSRNRDDCSFLTWEQRLNVCIGAARGINYLHTCSSIIHRDVKSTNILLDENFTSKVSDFGLAKHLSTSYSQSHVSTKVRGTFGYLDPSYFNTFKLTRESDTYAFGVVLLEVLCGRPAVDERLSEDEISLVMWAKEKISKGEVDQIVASNLRDEISEDCLKKFVGIAKRCLHPEPKKRPTMAKVVIHLDFALERQVKKLPIHKPSRFPPLKAVWSRFKPSGAAQKDLKQCDANVLATAIPAMKEDTLKDEQALNMLAIAAPAIPLHELDDITNYFSSDCLIGEGSKGRMYHGVLKSGQAAAIKRLDHSCLPEQEFVAQVSTVSSLKHENVVQLIGYCVDGDRQYVAYEFAQNGSLYDILHREQGVKGSEPCQTLSWAQRVKIAFGAAKGLEYFHEKGQIHGDIKSSNLLLFGEVSKIGCFGRSYQCIYKGLKAYRDEPHPCVFRQAGGYHPPEYTICGELSSTSDVYSFGMILLELLTGLNPVDNTLLDVKESLLATPRILWDKVHRYVDARLKGNYPPNAVKQMAVLASCCVQYDAEFRPEMRSVVGALSQMRRM